MVCHGHALSGGQNDRVHILLANLVDLVRPNIDHGQSLPQALQAKTGLSCPREKGARPMKSKITWILIADAARARVVRNDGPGRGLVPVEGMAFERDHLKQGDLMADKPGRSFESAGVSRHSMESGSDVVRELDRAFANMLVGVLQKALDRKNFDRLVVVAPPRALGDLRNALTGPLKAVLHAELGKDLTHVPNADLAGHLDTVLFV